MALAKRYINKQAKARRRQRLNAQARHRHQHQQGLKLEKVSYGATYVYKSL